MRLTAAPYGQGTLYFNLDAPYKDEKFILETDARDIDLTIFNPMIIPMTGLEIESGIIERLNLVMDASRFTARNDFLFNYSGLKVNLLVESRKEEFNNLGFLSAIANSAVSPQNLPGNPGYTGEKAFVTDRNILRSPFNLMWMSIKDGLTLIVPSDAASLFIKKKKRN
ncbi:MAG: hypothetical protein P8X57_04935 [Cyclobacteriaceae bacterium]